jgi:hypothetical protein
MKDLPSHPEYYRGYWGGMDHSTKLRGVIAYCVFHSLLKPHPSPLPHTAPVAEINFFPNFSDHQSFFSSLSLSWLSFHKLHTFPMSDLRTALKWNRWSSRKSCTINTTWSVNGSQECLYFSLFHCLHTYTRFHIRRFNSYWILDDFTLKFELRSLILT